MSKGKQILLVLLAIVGGSVVYNVYDNQRFIVVEETVTVARLPRSFDGFRILQISDLHGRTFGDKQVELIAAINGLEYDMIAFTGDMNRSDTLDRSAEESRPVLDLLEGIENKAHLFWVDGNTGPWAVESVNGLPTGRLSAIGKRLQETGCHILIFPYAMRRGEEQIWIAPGLSQIGLSLFNHAFETQAEQMDAEQLAGLQRTYEELSDSFERLNRSGEVKIMVSHYPRQMNMSAAELEPMGWLDYDLILAGHNHGGQWRLPLVGALYVPDPVSGVNGSGFFPSQEDVKGLTDSAGTPQVISAGLGASGHRWWTDFRLFNTPEINLITLVSGPSE